ncbi:hypothetical protein Tco_0425120 [Tanacetum coccineum]
MYRYNRKGFLEDDDSSDDSIFIVDSRWDDYCLGFSSESVFMTDKIAGGEGFKCCEGWKGEADEQLRFCKSWLLNGCTRKRLKVVIFCAAKLHQSLDTKNVESSSVRLEGLCKSALGSTIVSACLQQHGSVTSLVTGNVPVENALADSVKTQGRKIPESPWGSPIPIGDGDGDVNRFPDGDGDGDGDEAEKRGWGW